MKNPKFVGLALALAFALAGAVATIQAQDGRRDGGAQLGVMVSDVDANAAAAGVKIDDVNEDSPAEKAGIKAGDIVVDYDGERVRSARQFTRLVQETPDGRRVAIGIMRDGKKQTVNATPEAGRMTFRFEVPPPGDFQYHFDERDGPRRFEYRVPEGFRIPAPGSRFPSSRGRLGVSVQSITPELAEYFGAKNGGALVSSVTSESAAAKAGIKAGDVIVSINGKAISDADDLIRELEGISGDAAIVVLRDRKEMTLKAALDRPSGPQVVRPSVRG